MFTVDVGAPLWRFWARHGATVRVVINVMHDKEAGVYIADSPNLRGFVAEAPSLEELKSEIVSSVDELLTEQVEKKPKPPMLIWGDASPACA